MRDAASFNRHSAKHRWVSAAHLSSAEIIQRSSHVTSGLNDSDEPNASFQSPAKTLFPASAPSPLVSGVSTALITRRDACQSLLVKLRPSSSFSSSKKTSFPGGESIDRVKRNASVPQLSMMSRGSGELPSDLLILRPWPSRTMPVKNTCRNGISPRKKSDAMIMRATQKKMMSEPVTSTEFGWYRSRSRVRSGQPNGENVHS